MKKKIITSIIIMTLILTVTGCGCSKEDKKGNINTGDQTVVEDQIFEGLEFVNVGASNGIITTVVINNTGVVYEGSKFSMKIMDADGNVLKELTDEVTTKMETGTTQTIETKTDIDLSKAVSIEYSIVK